MARYALAVSLDRSLPAEEVASETELIAAISRRVYSADFESLRIDRVTDTPRDDPATLRNEAPGPSTDLIG